MKSSGFKTKLRAALSDAEAEDPGDPLSCSASKVTYPHLKNTANSQSPNHHHFPTIHFILSLRKSEKCLPTKGKANLLIKTSPTALTSRL